VAAVASTRRQGRSSSRSPKYFDTGEQQAEREREVIMTQPAAYARYNQRVWTNANLVKDFVSWIGANRVGKYHFFVLIRPGAAQKFLEIRQKLEASGASYGYDLIDQSRSLKLRSEAQR
jgi:hypothetical protein